MAINGGLTGYFKGGKIKKVLDEFKAFSGWETKEQKTEYFCACTSPILKQKIPIFLHFKEANLPVRYFRNQNASHLG